eukprot:7293381-Karenia_brevis.AAC.1
MALQPHTAECRKRFEGILKEEARVKNQKITMEEFEERLKMKRDKLKEKKDEVVVEESRDSG